MPDTIIHITRAEIAPDAAKLGLVWGQAAWTHEPTGVTYGDEDVWEAVRQFRRGVPLPGIEILQTEDDGTPIPWWTRLPDYDEDAAKFYTHDLIDANVTDLRREVDALDAHKGRLLGVVSEEQGGIIAYALGEDNAAKITAALLTQ